MNGRRVKILKAAALKVYKAMTPRERATYIARFDGGQVVDPWTRFWKLVKRNWARHRTV